MASRSFFIVDPDPTLIPGGITKAQLLQMMDQLTPESDLGLFFKSEIEPDVIIYPEYTQFLWLKPSTGELKFWNGFSWQLVFALASIADGTININKLSTSGGAPFQLIQVNSTGDAFQWVNPADLFAVGSIPVDRIEAVTQGDFLYAKSGTALEKLNFEDEFVEALLFAELPVANLKDTDTSGIANQVIALLAPGGGFGFFYVESLLRANNIAFDRLLYPANSENKIPVVNAGRTDVTFTSVTSLTGAKSAVVKFTDVSGTPAQIIAPALLTTVEFNSENDPDAFVTLATNQITLLTGKYHLSAKVPVFGHTGAAIVVILRDITAGADLATATGHTISSDAEMILVTLDHTVNIAAANNIYEIRIITDDDATLGVAASIAAYAETFQQMHILKIA